jgi:hypothetical protein
MAMRETISDDADREARGRDREALGKGVFRLVSLGWAITPARMALRLLGNDGVLVSGAWRAMKANEAVVPWEPASSRPAKRDVAALGKGNGFGNSWMRERIIAIGALAALSAGQYSLVSFASYPGGE